MFCYKCGNENKDESTFCRGCGVRLFNPEHFGQGMNGQTGPPVNDTGAGMTQRPDSGQMAAPVSAYGTMPVAAPAYAQTAPMATGPAVSQDFQPKQPDIYGGAMPQVSGQMDGLSEFMGRLQVAMMVPILNGVLLLMAAFMFYFVSYSEFVYLFLGLVTLVVTIFTIVYGFINWKKQSMDLAQTAELSEVENIRKMSAIITIAGSLTLILPYVYELIFGYLFYYSIIEIIFLIPSPIFGFHLVALIIVAIRLAVIVTSTMIFLKRRDAQYNVM
ncbi:MAG: zinc ribbon domain-containing protein [Thermoleophilia bacterium]|jgi:hypothetical protein